MPKDKNECRKKYQELYISLSAEQYVLFKKYLALNNISSRELVTNWILVWLVQNDKHMEMMSKMQ